MSAHPAIIFGISFFLCLCTSTISVFGQDQLDNVAIFTADREAREMVYDKYRNVIYASVGGGIGTVNKNSILTIDPETLEILDRLELSDAPNKLAISNDGSRVYFGLGGKSVSSFEPSTGKLGPVHALADGRTDFLGRFYRAQEIVVSPSDPKTIVVSSRNVGLANSGVLEVFNDTGKLNAENSDTSSDNFLDVFSKSLAFVGPNVVIGYREIDDSPTTVRFSFDGNLLTLEKSLSLAIYGPDATIQETDGLIYSSSGDVLDPTTLSPIGTFPGAELRGGYFTIEVSASDQLAYIISDTILKVYDSSSFILLDEAELPISKNKSTFNLMNVGANRLAILNSSGEIHIISGIQFSPPPLPRINIAGTSEDDWVTFDSATREISVNGVVTSIPFETTKIHFYGNGGVDHVTSVGDPDEDEFAVLQGTEMTVRGDTYLFAAHDVAELEFESTSRSDICAIFDSEADEELASTPTSVKLQHGDSLLQATNVGDVFVFSSGENDSARMKGSVDSERVFGNMEDRRIRMIGEEFFIALSGFENANANGGLGENDVATIVDSEEQEIAFFRGDFARMLNSQTDYSVRGFTTVNFSSASGNDIGVFQQTFDSSVAGNGIWESLIGPDYRSNAFGLNFLQVRE